MGGAHADVSKHVKSYMAVFAALAVFTILTVWAATWPTSTPMHIGVAMLIATIKASLVAAIFMHLKWENSGAIWWTLLLTGIFFAALILLPVLTSLDNPPQVRYGTWG